VRFHCIRCAGRRLPTGLRLFAVLIWGGLFGVIVTSFTITAAPAMGPQGSLSNEEVRPEWLARQWISTARVANRSAIVLMVVAGGPLLVSTVLRVITNVAIPVTPFAISIFAAGSGVLILMSIVIAAFWTANGDRGQVGVRRWEAYGSTLTITADMTVLLFVVPLT
jgi:hypothetical protein